MILLSNKTLLALFICVVALPFQAKAVGAAGAVGEASINNDPDDTEVELGSLLILHSALRASSWCPEKRMIVATASGSRKVTLNVSRERNFTAYVNDQFVPKENIRVTKNKVSVCVPRHGEPTILIYGADSENLPVEYTNVE